jgi:hypothetical protein
MADPAAPLELAQSPTGRGGACFVGIRVTRPAPPARSGLSGIGLSANISSSVEGSSKTAPLNSARPKRRTSPTVPYRSPNDRIASGRSTNRWSPSQTVAGSPAGSSAHTFPWIPIGAMIAWTAVLTPLAVKLFKWR